jgi:acetate---CoA ligase (ADP-forming)
VLVELADQASVRFGPVDEREARAMLFETAAGKLLQGARGAPARDIDAAAAAIAALNSGVRASEGHQVYLLGMGLQQASH